MEEPEVITIFDVIGSTVMHINKGKAREGIRQAGKAPKGLIPNIYNYLYI